MKFSLMHLMGLLLLAGLAFPLLQQKRRLRNAVQRRASLQTQKTELESKTLLYEPLIDQFHSLEDTRDSALKKFEELRVRYGNIQPGGPGVFSYRSIPSLRMHPNDPIPVVVGLFVPSDRDVWVKYAVVREKRGTTRLSRELDRISSPTIETGFTQNGPYQRKLGAGEHVLRFTRIRGVEPHRAELPSGDLELPSDGADRQRADFELRIDDNVWLAAAFVSDNGVQLRGASSEVMTQLDHERTAQLPVLIRRSVPGSEFAFYVWFSDQDSGFVDFPRVHESDG